MASTLAVWVVSRPYAWHIAFILAAIAAWGAYAIARLARKPALLRTWGLARPAAAWRLHALATIAGVAAVVLLAWLHPPARLPSVPWFAWPVYLAWAGAQEFAVQAIVVLALVDVGVPRWAVAPVVGAAFAFGHAPRWELAALAFAGGVLWTGLFLRHRNLWLVILSHAIVGALALILVLGENPVGGFYGVPLR